YQSQELHLEACSSSNINTDSDIPNVKSRSASPAIFFKFQFRNVNTAPAPEQNLPVLRFWRPEGKESVTSRGYLRTSTAAAHAEMAFFNPSSPSATPSPPLQNITWYVPLKNNKNLRLTIMVGVSSCREEPRCSGPEKHESAGCKLRIMKPQDFEYVWQNFVEQEEGEEAKDFVPWEDIQENFNYYEEKLAEILH
uniref:Uncharacterized protein n=1 Tax=Melopsittacus undulatus TaxID=13146 RepID=A0A8V5HDT5_MELUD